MDRHKKQGSRTISVHAGSSGDQLYKGLSTPIFPSSAYDYEGVPSTIYPRYFNTPNQRAIIEKMAAVEHAEDGVVFSSGMSAIMTSIFSFVKTGDHVIFQSDLYGGTHFAISTELPRAGISFTLVDAQNPTAFEQAITPATKLIYIETPSNPTLKITDIKAVAAIAKRHKLITLIDNTFASPVNQNPIDLGIDIVLHSGTKYIGGHSDLCCGVMVSNKEYTQIVNNKAINLGGNLDPFTCYLVERSLKTIGIRVKQQNENALALAEFLHGHARIGKVFYPGLSDHPGHDIAKQQMPGGFGGMLSFEVKEGPHKFVSRLQLIKRALSLGGVESTICSPMRTSHSKMTAEQRVAIGVNDNLLRFSVGIENVDDLIDDIKNAFSK